MNPKKNCQLPLNKYLLNDVLLPKQRNRSITSKKWGRSREDILSITDGARGFTIFYYGDSEVEEITHGLFS